MAIDASKNAHSSIFLDYSKRRKWYFRIFMVAVLFFVSASLFLFLFGLSFTSSSREAITYKEAIERYHYYYSPANNKKIALTFDDGPNPAATPKIVQTLSSLDAPATFFFIGNKALVRPDLVREANRLGFDIEDHSFTHSYAVQSSLPRTSFELNSTGYLLSQITGKDISFYRPPYLLGIGIDPSINPYIAPEEDLVWILQNGYLPVGSDIDTRDWLAKNPEEIVEGLASALQSSPNGHIVLLHDDVTTAKAMDLIVAYLREHGYSIVPLAELLTPPTSFAFTQTFGPGDSDRTTDGAVSTLQWFLYKQQYLDAYALSGVFDIQTKTALINFQTRNKLIDPQNPDPRVLGIAESRTRAYIEKISLEQAPAPVTLPAESMSSLLWRSAGGILLSLYINIFPLIYLTLTFMIALTLVLVAARTLGLILLLILRSWRGAPLLSPIHTGEPVSILIPAYNEEENIAATVESVIASTYRPREIVVINDGSKDNTAQEVQSVIDAHPGEDIRLMTIENGGKANALNRGAREAKHNIIVVLDADAVLDKDAIAHFMPHFEDEDVAAVAGKVCTTHRMGFLDTFQTLEYAIGQNIDKTAFSTIGAVGIVPGPAGAWRRLEIEAAGGFHTDTLVEDQEMTLTLLHRGRKVVFEARAIAYTETPHTIKNFLKQRFRWVYGSMQCFWKHKSIFVERPDSVMSLVIMPNIFVYNIFLPLMYPFADSAFLFGLVFGEWRTLVLPFLAFTLIDMLYALWGLRGEQNKWRLMLAVPLQRVVYRQLLYYTVYKALIRALEGTGTAWNKFAKIGETRRFFLASMGGVSVALQTPVVSLAAPLLSRVAERVPQEPKIVPSIIDVEESLYSESVEEAMPVEVLQRIPTSESSLSASVIAAEEAESFYESTKKPL